MNPELSLMHEVSIRVHELPNQKAYSISTSKNGVSLRFRPKPPEVTAVDLLIFIESDNIVMYGNLGAMIATRKEYQNLDDLFQDLANM